ncbi:MAG: serine/threonine-protein phosphatase [Firmicutes bacterium]|nr:serine/threonine-protein phosphatase [Dethiobacter sp.]MBS3889075.1 serine/threonine-protein phosphatase [Bacillota bacterium]MBS4055100.1 serine/threonine-protein phosphatase [Thermaerobacter sp.]
MLEVKIAVAKTNKYAVSESGDSLEITERPQGGVSVIMADAQGSGKSARTNSKLVVSKAATLISEGARDGAVARAVHDMLYALRDGRISATLVIASADFETQSVVISQNAGPPIFVVQGGTAMTLSPSDQPIGVHRSMKPAICEFPLEQGLAIVGMTDGVYHAGRAKGRPWADEEFVDFVKSNVDHPEFLANALLAEAVRRDMQRPCDDMAVFVLRVGEYDAETKVRTMRVTLQC